MKRNVIGISIEPGRLRWVESVGRKGRLGVVRAGTVPFRSGGSESLGQALQQGLSGVTARQADIHCALCWPNMFVGPVMTPPMPRPELTDAIRWEVKEHLTAPVNDTFIAFEVRERIRQGDAQKVSLLAAAALRHDIEAIVSGVDAWRRQKGRPGWRLTHIIPAALALENTWAGRLQAAEDTAVVHLGEEITEMCFYHGGRIQFARRLPLAGEDFTTSMTKALVSPEGKIELSREEAEEVRRVWGIAPRDSDERVAGKITGKQLYMLVRPQLEKLVNELRRSLSFYEQKYGYAVRHVYLSGASADFKGLEGYLNDALGVTVTAEINGPPLPVNPDLIEARPVFAQEYDLALGAVLSDRPALNLMPPKPSLMGAGAAPVGRYVMLAALIALVSGGYGWAHIEKAKAEGDWQTVQERYRSVRPQLDDLRARLKLATVSLDRADWRGVLRDVSRSLTDDILFDEMWTEESVLYIKGTVNGRQRDGRASLSAFVSRLNQEPCRRAQLIQVRQPAGDNTAMEFRLSCSVR